MHSTDKQVLLWAEEAAHSFRFLQEKGYIIQPPQLDTVWGSITFLGAVLGVRLEVVTDEFYMYLAIFRCERPDYDNSEYLQTCLRQLGESTESFDRVVDMRGDFSKCGEIITILSSELRNSLSVIESEMDRLFPR